MTDNPKDSFWSAARQSGLIEAILGVGRSLGRIADKNAGPYDKIAGLFTACLSLTSAVKGYRLQREIAKHEQDVQKNEEDFARAVGSQPAPSAP